jgi:hypothetical protein
VDAIMPRGLVASALHGVYTNPTFHAPLTNSLLLTRGTGSPTFTRSDAANYSATVTDFEGLIRPVKNGELRFEGARRVENLIPTSSASLASGSNKTITVVAGEYVFSMGAANKFTLSAGTFIVTASVATLVELMFENVTGQTNTNPSEYISVGVLTTPYHGANVDGVCYKITYNNNTII